MAINRIWQSGLESGSLFELASTNAALNTGIVKTGTYSLAVNRANTSSKWGTVVIPATRQIRFGLFLYTPVAVTDNEWWSFMVRDVSENILTGILQKGSDGGNSFTMRVGAVPQGATTYEPLKWTHFGFDIKIDSSSGWVNVYKDGVEVISFVGNTGNADITKFVFGHTGGGTAGAPTLYFDDVYIEDTTGEGSSAICPLLRFYPLTMNGNGNYSQWDGSDGNQVDNYQLVDEIPPSEADYVETAVVDEFDSYAMSNITLDTGQTIQAVIPLTYTKRDGSTEEIALGTRLSSTDLAGSDQAPGSSSGFLWERQITKPGGGSWGESDVNSAELLIKSRGSY